MDDLLVAVPLLGEGLGTLTGVGGVAGVDIRLDVDGFWAAETKL